MKKFLGVTDKSFAPACFAPCEEGTCLNRPFAKNKTTVIRASLLRFRGDVGSEGWDFKGGERRLQEYPCLPRKTSKLGKRVKVPMGVVLFFDLASKVRKSAACSDVLKQGLCRDICDRIIFG